MPIPIYYITDEPDNEKNPERVCAEAMMPNIPGSFVEHLSIKTNRLRSTTTTAKAFTQTPKEIILLAHTDTGTPPTTIGDKTPKVLAEGFKAMFSGKSKKEKAELTDIFLISCEAGMGSPSLAQQFAAAMVDKGFPHIKIHAVAHPDGMTFGGGVEVTTRTGAWTGGTKGQVTGYYYGNQEAKEYAQYESLTRKKIRLRTLEEKQQLVQLKTKYKDFKPVIITLVTDLEDMRDPYNTFNSDGPEARISKDMAFTLSFLKKVRNTTLVDGAAEAIDGIINNLKLHSHLTHRDIMFKIDDAIKNSSSGGIFSVNMRDFLKKRKIELIQELNQFTNGPARIESENMFEDDITEETPLLPSTIQQQLTNYANQRKNEGGFYWDFLYLKTFSFWLSDSISSLAKTIGLIEESTDYLNSKFRDTKVSAAEKLVDLIENSDAENMLSPAEIHALSEGTLGSIVTKAGGLGDLLQNRPSTYTENDPSSASKKMQ
jgi:hypothetical protein